MSLNYNILKLAPGQIDAINAEGSNFHVVFAPVDVEIMWPGGVFATFPQGTGVDEFPNGGKFNRLHVKNPSLGDIFVVIWVGGPKFKDNRSAIIEPKTRGKGWNGSTLAATTAQAFNGIPTGNQIRRKAIQVTNLDANLKLQVRDTSGYIILTVFPETSITLPISEACDVYNPNGAGVALNISEIWWEAN